MDQLAVPGWTPDLFRVVVVGLTAPPAVGKVLGFANSVAYFAALGIPRPRVAVALVAVVEVGAVVLLLLDRWRWVAAAPLLPTMAVAFRTTGEWQAVAVFLAAAGLVTLETGLLAATGPSRDGSRTGESG